MFNRNRNAGRSISFPWPLDGEGVASESENAGEPLPGELRCHRHTGSERDMAIPATPVDNPDKITASNPLRPLLVTVLVAKVMVSVFLLATVSFSPSVSADPGYLAALN